MTSYLDDSLTRLMILTNTTLNSMSATRIPESTQVEGFL